MTTPITIEDIYKLFQASKELDDARAIDYEHHIKEIDRRAAEQKAENEKMLAESRAEIDRRAAEQKAENEKMLAESRAENERMLADSRAENEKMLADSRAENDRRAAEQKAESDRLAAEQKAESDRRMAELDKSVKDVVKSVGALTTRWGQFVEGLVEPAVVELFQQRGIDVLYVHHRIYTKRQGYAMEIDIMAINGMELVLVECKSRLSQDDVDEFVDKLGRFKRSFPAYQNYKVYGAVAGIEINEGIDRYAFRKGLFVIKPSGDSVAIINDDMFQAHAW